MVIILNDAQAKCEINMEQVIHTVKMGSISTVSGTKRLSPRIFSDIF